MNWPRLSDCLSSVGKEFHTRGPATAKHRSPQCSLWIICHVNTNNGGEVADRVTTHIRFRPIIEKILWYITECDLTGKPDTYLKIHRLISILKTMSKSIALFCSNEEKEVLRTRIDHWDSFDKFKNMLTGIMCIHIDVNYRVRTSCPRPLSVSLVLRPIEYMRQIVYHTRITVDAERLICDVAGDRLKCCIDDAIRYLFNKFEICIVL